MALSVNDYLKKYNSLSDNKKDILSCFVLAVEDTSMSFFQSESIASTLPDRNLRDWRVADCVDMAKEGLLSKMSSSFEIPDHVLPYLFPEIFKAWPKTAMAIHKGLTAHHTLHRGFYFFAPTYRRTLRLLMLESMGQKVMDWETFNRLSYDSRIDFPVFKTLIVNPVFHQTLQKLPYQNFWLRLSEELIVKFYSLEPIPQIEEWLSSYALFFDQLSKKDPELDYSLTNLLLPNAGPVDVNNEKISSQVRNLFSLLLASDLNDTRIINDHQKSIFSTTGSKPSNFHNLSPVLGYSFLIVLLEKQELALRLSAKIFNYFTHDYELRDFTPFVFLLLNQRPKARTELKKRLSQKSYVRRWDALCLLLITAWLTDTPIDTADRQEVKEMLDRLHSGGYIIPAYELSWIANELDADPSIKKTLTQLSTRLSHNPLVSRLEKKADFEIALNAIIALTGAEKEQPDSSKYRLSYRIYSGDGIIEVYQQTRKSETWTSGKKIPLRRLAEEAVEGMTDQDREIARTLVLSKDYYSPGYYFGPNCWKAMVGHPNLFEIDNPAVPVQLLLHKPALVIDKNTKSYTLRFDVAIPPISFPIIKETETRWLFVETDELIRKISDVIPGGKMTIPLKHNALIDRTVGAVSKHLNVISDRTVDGVNSAAIVREPDNRLRVLLLPLGEGLRAQIHTKPFGDFPPYCRPGEGGGVLFTRFEKEAYKVTRNMKGEMGHLDLLLRSLEEAGLTTDNDLTLDFPDPFGALTMLELLRQASEYAVVEWPEGVKFTVTHQAGLKNLHLAVKKKGNWFDVSGELKISEDLVLDIKKLISAPRVNGQRFLELSEGNFLALSDALRHKIDEMQSLLQREKNNLNVSALALPLLLADSNDVARMKTDKASNELFQRYNQAQEMKIVIPETLEAELRPYQEEGFQWMTRLASWDAGACLADDMGLGKTVQTLALLLHRAQNGASLVVCPASVLPNWLSETNRFAPTLRVVVLNNNGRAETVASLSDGDLLITTYGLLQSEAELLGSVQWNVVVLDEAHVIKNHVTKTYGAAIGLPAMCRIALSGTPVQNRPDDLWSIFSFLNPGLLGSLSAFNTRFATPISLHDDSLQKGLLKKLIAPFLLRRLKQNVLEELPPKIEIAMSVSLSQPEMAFYEALRRQALENIATVGKSGAAHLQALTELTRLRLACCDSRLIDGAPAMPSSKQEAFLQLIEELIANKHRALVFSQFTSHLALIRKALDQKDIRYLYLDGSTPIKERGKLVIDFQKGATPLFLISLKAGGLGLNLTSADFVVHLDPWWNPAVEDQATDRAHRIGQNRPVTVYRLVAADTIEEKIIKLHHTKRELAESLLEGADAPRKVDLKELVSLIKS